MRWAIVAGLTLLLALCLVLAWQGWQRYRALEQGETWTRGIAVYGRFCGPGHPLTRQVGTPEEAAELAAIDPIDAIDAACKTHDLCYARRGYFDPACDSALTGALAELVERFEDHDSEHGRFCARLSRLLADYFTDEEAGLQDIDAVRAWLSDAMSLPVDLRQSAADLLEIYLAEEEDPLRCGLPSDAENPSRTSLRALEMPRPEYRQVGPQSAPAGGHASRAPLPRSSS